MVTPLINAANEPSSCGIFAVLLPIWIFYGNGHATASTGHRRIIRTSIEKKHSYLIALFVLSVLVVALGSLELLQVATQTPGVPYPSVSAGSHQAVITPNQHAAAPVRTLTAGTIKENVRLTCSGCDNPVLTTISSITVDTTNLRTVWTMNLENVSGAQQIDYFAEFSLQDPFGNTYVGTGNLNTDFFLDAGQSAVKTEIFSFLPHPGVSYTLIARLGISGRTYNLSH